MAGVRNVVNSKTSIKWRHLFDSAAAYERFYKFWAPEFDKFSADSVGVFHCLGAF